jgi:hypothetical protein
MDPERVRIEEFRTNSFFKEQLSARMGLRRSLDDKQVPVLSTDIFVLSLSTKAST